MGKIKLWSEYEENYLKQFYGDFGPVWVGEKLNRTPDAVIKRAIHLGIKHKRIKVKYHKENLERIVNESKCIGQVLDNLGLRRAGGNYGTIQKYITSYGINTEHFEVEEMKQLSLLSDRLKKKIKTEDILIQYSSYSRAKLKERLYKEGYKERVCEICGQGEEWNGKKMSLILDHINGVWNDNRIENLRIVCPNCNATLDTHCGKNKPLSVEEKQQPMIESSVNRRTVNRPPYEILIKEVEDYGYRGTGVKYGVSDNAIRKWIKFYKNYNK